MYLSWSLEYWALTAFLFILYYLPHTQHFLPIVFSKVYVTEPCRENTTSLSEDKLTVEANLKSNRIFCIFHKNCFLLICICISCQLSCIFILKNSHLPVPFTTFQFALPPSATYSSFDLIYQYFACKVTTGHIYHLFSACCVDTYCLYS